MRLSRVNGNGYLFPAPTQSGHIKPSSLKKQHVKAIAESTRLLRERTKRKDIELRAFELSTLRHTCLTRWAPHMDPWTLAYLGGHGDMNITKRYLDPQEQTIRDAMDRAGVAHGGHSSGHTSHNARFAECGNYVANNMTSFRVCGAPGEIRTPDLLVRSQTLYPAELRAH